MKRHRKTEKGFTLIETAIVIIISGIFLVSGLTLLRDYLHESYMNKTRSRMQAVENAINAFYSSTGRLPCVASLTAQESAANFGEETGPNCPSATVGGTFQATAPSGDVVQIGTVPTRSLDLPDEDMTDAWDDNLIYAVTANLASATIATSVASGAIAPVTSGEIAVVDSNGNPVANPAGSAQYVIISHGQDRAGAYSGGKLLGIPCTAGTTESPNCTFKTPMPWPVTFVKTLLTSSVGDATQYDDYVDYYTWLQNNGALPKGIIMTFDDGLQNPAACPTTEISSTNPNPLWAPPSAAVQAVLNPVTLPIASLIYCEKQQ